MPMYLRSPGSAARCSSSVSGRRHQRADAACPRQTQRPATIAGVGSRHDLVTEQARLGLFGLGGATRLALAGRSPDDLRKDIAGGDLGAVMSMATCPRSDRKECVRRARQRYCRNLGPVARRSSPLRLPQCLCKLHHATGVLDDLRRLVPEMSSKKNQPQLVYISWLWRCISSRCQTVTCSPRSSCAWRDCAGSDCGCARCDR